MTTAAPVRSPAAARRRRDMVTPEGLSLPLTVASRGARAGALLLDLAIIFFAFVLVAIMLALMGFGLFGLGSEAAAPAFELVGVIFILLMFFARYGYFLFFELGPRGATPGKRLLGIRVAARGSGGSSPGRLTAEAVIARNLIRDVEVFLPAFFLASGAGALMGVAGLAVAAWMAVFVLFPFFNRDGLRAGDLVAGTWVVEAGRHKLPAAISVGEDRSRDYRFGEAELSVYGEHELQVLEGVLRRDDPQAQRQVLEAICRKIGWQVGRGDDREFLEAFYAALRARLERDMRFGQRKKDKFS